MTARIYKVLGRIYLRFILIRYRRQIRIAAALGIAAAGVAGYLAMNREPPEG